MSKEVRVLLSLRLANHGPYLDEEWLDLGTKTGGAEPVTAVYGPSGSGKTFLLEGLRYIQESLKAGRPVPWPTFRSDRLDASEELSRHAVTLLSGGVRYNWGFSAREGVVHEEWLYCYPYGRKRTIFEHEDPSERLLLPVPDREYSRRALPVVEWFANRVVWCPTPKTADEAAAVVEAAVRDGKLLVGDDFGKHLHPGFLVDLVGVFQSPVLNKNAQLLFTTDNSDLLDPVLGTVFRGMLKPSQIWALDKDPTYGSATLVLRDPTDSRCNRQRAPLA